MWFKVMWGLNIVKGHTPGKIRCLMIDDLRSYTQNKWVLLVIVFVVGSLERSVMCGYVFPERNRECRSQTISVRKMCSPQFLLLFLFLFWRQSTTLGWD